MFDKNLTKKMQDVVLDGKLAAKEVCSRINKPYSTLLRELNPFDQHAKLGAETMFEIIKVTNDIKILEFMARELGYKLSPLSSSKPAMKKRTANSMPRPDFGQGEASH